MNYLITIAAIFTLLAGFIAVERLYRRFAARIPELGPFRDGEAGWGSCGGCAGASCEAPANGASAPAGECRTHGTAERRPSDAT